MSDEFEFIRRVRSVATDPAARGLMDDAALLDVGGARLILTSDTIVEGVHYRPADPPDTIGWKLAAVNLSDLAAKGGRPLGCLMNYALSGDADWDGAFLSGLKYALDQYAMPLIGGDTVAMPKGAPRSYTLTAIGEAQPGPVPSRAGAKPGDGLFLTGPVGDAGAGLRILEAGRDGPRVLIDAYRRPKPRLDEGRLLAPQVHAMMDVSDGLFIDARRMAEASGIGLEIDHVPVSDAFRSLYDSPVGMWTDAAMAGDDYELLYAAPEAIEAGFPSIRVGSFVERPGLSWRSGDLRIPLPERLGYEHEARGR